MSTIINATTTNGVVIQPDNSGSLQLATNSGTTAVTIDTSQNVGIGTTSPAAKLNVATGSSTLTQNIVTIKGGGASGSFAGLSVQSNSGDEIFNVNNLSYNVTMGTVAGKVIIGATTSVSGTRLSLVAATSGVDTNTSSITSTSGTRYHWTFQDGASPAERGSITTNGSATAYNTSSDYRLKENILPMTGALATVQALKPVTYTWKESGDNSQGFIAHELQAVVPDCVTGEKDAVETYTDEEGNEQTRPKYQSIDTSFLVATLTAAIQEQQTIINDLKTRIETLEAK